MPGVLIHIVPHLPPQNSGVGDYATLVGRRMEEIGGVTCGYVAAGRIAVEQPADSERVRNITGRCASEALWRAVEELADGIEPYPGPSLRGRGDLAVVLHYSGYGYDQNGAPSWLANALTNRLGGRSIRIVTYFHELYATGRPWQRAFWYSARQRRIAGQVARMSDACLTNCERYARWLDERLGRNGVVSVPICSCIGEPEHVPAYESRPMRAVTFGNAQRKQFALAEDAARVAAALRKLDISELVDIGARCAIDERAFHRVGIAIKQRGYLGAADVSRLLLTCRLGLLYCNTHYLTKSGTYAAYAAHGVVPVIKCAARSSERHFPFVLLDELSGSRWDQLQSTSESMRRLYSQASAHRHAMAILHEFGHELKTNSAADCEPAAPTSGNR